MKPIGSLAACLLTRQYELRAGGLYLQGATMQKRLGLDLEVPDGFGYWMAGFTDGEGHFGAIIVINQNGHRQLDTTFKISLRADDEPTLERIREILGVGTLWGYDPYDPTGGRNPVVKYTVRRIADLYHIIVPLFEKYPLQSKKATDFEIWKNIIDIKYHEGGWRSAGFRRGTLPTPESFWAKAEPLVKQLKQGRKFSP